MPFKGSTRESLQSIGGYFFFTRFLCNPGGLNLLARWEMVPSKAVVLLRLGTAEFQYPVFVMICRKIPMDMHLVSAGFTRQGWLTLEEALTPGGKVECSIQ